ncbi:formin BNI1-like isoform X2 [Xenia sp. Carnegie-2017]|uniref:formin BNI1-like isoform X2 n=1 Tax=Xenia sp. Carnegie-2017 TaxID=2897299 RepID=UPI001F03624F|nr:formin BNI1-like isoform X2 [Xenia sp. Carnegie-2017]
MSRKTSKGGSSNVNFLRRRSTVTRRGRNTENDEQNPPVNDTKLQKEEQQRILIGNLVKSGQLSVDEAMSFADSTGLTGNSSSSISNFRVYKHTKDKEQTERQILQFDFNEQTISTIRLGKFDKQIGFDEIRDYESKDDLKFFIDCGEYKMECDAATAEEKIKICDFLEAIVSGNKDTLLSSGKISPLSRSRISTLQQKVIKEGHVEFATFFSWKKRFIRIKEGELSCYKIGKENATPLNIFKLGPGHSSVKKHEYNAFKVLAQKKEYVFRIMNPKKMKDVDAITKERDEWFAALSEAFQPSSPYVDGTSSLASPSLPKQDILNSGLEQDKSLKNIVECLQKELGQLKFIMNDLDAPSHATAQMEKIDDIVKDLNHQIKASLLTWTMNSMVAMHSTSSFPMNPHRPTISKRNGEISSNSNLELNCAPVDVTDGPRRHSLQRKIIDDGASTEVDGNVNETGPIDVTDGPRNHMLRRKIIDDGASTEVDGNVNETGPIDVTDGPRNHMLRRKIIDDGASTEVDGNVNETGPIDVTDGPRNHTLPTMIEDGDASTEVDDNVNKTDPSDISNSKHVLESKNDNDNQQLSAEVKSQSSASCQDSSLENKKLSEAFENSVSKTSVSSSPGPLSLSSASIVPTATPVDGGKVPLLPSPASSPAPPSALPPPPLPPPPPPSVCKPKPTIQFRQLPWIKVPDKLFSSSLWSKAKDRINELDVEMIKSRFKVKKDDALSENIFQRKNTQNVKKRTLIMDEKRAQTLEIFLKAAKLNANNIDMRLNCIDETDGLPLEKVQFLKSHLPKREDKKKYKDYKDGNKDLTKADQFMMKLCEIPDLNERLDIIYSIREFPLKYKELSSIVSLVVKCCDDVVESTKLRVVLEYILAFGNILNIEKARGFQTSSLPKLYETRDLDRSYSLLHLLVDILNDKNKDALSLPEDLSSVKDVTEASVKALTAEVEVLCKSLPASKKLVRNLHSKFNEADKEFHNDVIKIFNDYELSLKKLEKSCDRMNESYSNMLKFLGEPPKKYSEEVFSDLNKFLTQFSSVIQEKKKRKSVYKVPSGKDGLQQLMRERVNTCPPLKSTSQKTRTEKNCS